MRNILSYEPGTKFSGKEILDWAKYQVENKTSHEKYGEVILRRFGNIKPEKMYCVETHHPGTGRGEIIRKPLVMNVVEI
jgi:hypothetical protein